MRYREIGVSPATRRTVSVLSLGAMTFGTTVDEAASFAILDRFAEAGGTFVDTADNYAYWVHGTQGGESEALLGRWRRSRGVGEEIVIATKLGGRPPVPTTGISKDIEGLSAAVIRESAERSRERLGVERIDLLYAHGMDPAGVPQEESVEAFAGLVADGTAGLLGASNHWAWRLDRARGIAAATGVPGFEVLQYHRTYLQPRSDIPTLRSPDGSPGLVGPDLLSYLREEPGLALVAYSPLIGGAYTRDDKPIPAIYDHPGGRARLAALREVAAETGATAGQVALAWLIGAEIPSIPIVGASTVAQLDESLEAADLELTAEQRARLDTAG
ncbi:MAG TPA: aldo/keto reductase [Phytomonospora sp.]